MSIVGIQPVDLAILLVSAAACLYCSALNRRLKALQDTRDGLGSSIKAFSQSVSAVSNSTQEARLQTSHLVTQLSQLIGETEQKCDKVRQLMGEVDSLEIDLTDRIASTRSDYDSLIADINDGQVESRLAADAARIDSVIAGGKQEIDRIQKITGDMLLETKQLKQALQKMRNDSDADYQSRERSATQLHQKRMDQIAAAETGTLGAFQRSREEIEQQVISIREEWALMQKQQKTTLLLLNDSQKAQTVALAEVMRNAERTLESHLADILKTAVKEARTVMSAEGEALDQVIASAEVARKSMNRSSEELESSHRKANARIMAATASLEKLMAEAISEAEQKVSEMTVLASQMTALTKKTSAAIEDAVRKTSTAPQLQSLREVLVHDV